MRDENAIIATRIEVLAAEDGGYTVLLDGERRVRLDPEDPRTPGYRSVFDQLREQRRPVYVEVDPERGTVVRVLLPLPTRVVRIEERDDELLLELAGSHAVHLVDLRGADADELSSSLRAAHESRGGILVIEDESHQVMDVMEFTPAPDGPALPPFPQLPVPELLIPRPPFWRRLWDWFWDWLLWWWRCPSAAAAQTIFDQLGATTCPPLTVPAPCIPFMYPDNGCWARAHEMCRLMLALGRAPRKVWIKEGPQGPLRVDTKNNPNCHVQWWYHVAPTLCVRTVSISVVALHHRAHGAGPVNVHHARSTRHMADRLHRPDVDP